MGIVRAMQSARKETSGSLHEIEIVPAHVSLPSAEVMASALSEVQALKYVRESHWAVFEGDSMRRSLVRGVFATFSFLVGDDFTVCTSGEEAIVRLSERLGQDPRASLDEARRGGLLADLEPPAIES